MSFTRSRASLLDNVHCPLQLHISLQPHATLPAGGISDCVLGLRVRLSESVEGDPQATSQFGTRNHTEVRFSCFYLSYVLKFTLVQMAR